MLSKEDTTEAEVIATTLTNNVSQALTNLHAEWSRTIEGILAAQLDQPLLTQVDLFFLLKNIIHLFPIKQRIYENLIVSTRTMHECSRQGSYSAAPIGLQSHRLIVLSWLVLHVMILWYIWDQDTRQS